MARDLVPYQFGDVSLSKDEAGSACGPAAAVAFARAFGRNPTLREAVDLAKKVGWSIAGGMNGVGNQKRLLDAMGIPSRLSTKADVKAIEREASTGNPVAISTAIHYYVADDYDPKTGLVHVGNSGLARRNGAEWMSLDQISERDGGINGTLFMDHPDVAAPSQESRSPVQRAIDKGKQFLSDVLGPTTAEAAENDAPATGGDPVVQSRQAAPANIDPTLQKLVNAKGAWTSVYPVNPEVDNPDADRNNPDTYDPTAPKKMPNPSPTYRYVWDDGTHVDIKSEGGTPTRPATFTVVGGTALATLAKQDAKDKEPPKVTTIGGKPFVWDEPSGSFKPAPGLPSTTEAKPATNKQVVQRNGKAYIYDPETGSFTPATGLPDEAQKPATVNTSPSEQYVVQQMPDGTLKQVPNPNYVPPKPNKPDVHIAGNRVVIVGPDGQLTTQVIDPEAQALATQQAQLGIQQSQQNLLPKTLLAIQNHAALVKDLTNRVATGAMTPEEADNYISQSKAYTQAALQGASPFDLQKQRDENERQARQDGISLINQRLSSGSALAANLTNAAAGLAQHSLFAPGQTSFGVDPLAIARAYTTEMGGGPQVSDFAQQLLRGSQPQHAGLG